MYEYFYNGYMLDNLDQEIVRFLQYNGRMPYTRIAKELGVSEGAVRSRVKRMVDEKLMQIVGLVEPEAQGYHEAAMIGINVQSNLTEAVSDEIAHLEEVRYLFQVGGEFDLFAEVYCTDRDEFVDFLNNKLQKIPGVLRTHSFMILKMHKLSYRWGQAEPPKDRWKSRKLDDR
jgi:Lrp/AsnC family transcriptional regulator for asnA, asnC and gidA